MVLGGSELRMAAHFCLFSALSFLNDWRVFYAYILESCSAPGEFYRGHTSDLKQRLADHNAGRCPHTSKIGPWKIKFYAAFETLDLAQRFEYYLKSGSGHSFAKRHFNL